MSQIESSVKVEVAHVLSKEQLNAIGKQVYQVTIESINQARRDSELDADLLFSKTSAYEWLGVSYSYFEELLAKGLPQGKALSDTLSN